MGWDFHKVTLPDNPQLHSFELVNEFGVNKKTELEVLYPFTFLLEKVKELGFSKVVFGQITTVGGRKRSVMLRNDPGNFGIGSLKTTHHQMPPRRSFQVFKDDGIIVCCRWKV